MHPQTAKHSNHNECNPTWTKGTIAPLSLFPSPHIFDALLLMSHLGAFLHSFFMFPFNPAVVHFPLGIIDLLPHAIPLSLSFSFTYGYTCSTIATLAHPLATQLALSACFVFGVSFLSNHSVTAPWTFPSNHTWIQTDSCPLVSPACPHLPDPSFVSLN